MRTWAVEKMRGLFKGERGECLLLEISERAPFTRPLVYRLTPQPGVYQASEERIATRHGLRFRFRLGHYFQWHHFFKREDPVLEQLVALAEGKHAFIDVGANIGLYSLVVRKVMAPGARVLAIEPSSSTNAALREHVSWSGFAGVEVFDFALSATSGRAELAAGGDDWGKASLARPDGSQTSEEVETRTLDDLVRESAITTLDLLKIDVEGHENAVLSGARRTIEDLEPTIVIEFSPQWMEPSGIAEICDQLEGLVARGYGAREIRADGVVEFPIARLRCTRDQKNLLFVSPRFCDQTSPSS